MNGISTRTLLVIAVLLSGAAAMAQDRDDDGIADPDDNCPAFWNPNQSDGDGDGLGAPCDCEEAIYVLERRGQQALLPVSGVTDVDGDGVDDLLVGEKWPLETNCEDTVTRTFVLSGRTRALQWQLTSGETCDAFGSAVSGGGDLDGDGVGDVIVGAERGGNGGRVYVYSGATARLLFSERTPFSFQGERAGDRFGASVTFAGDVNQDGVDDLAVGAPLHGMNGPAAGRRGRVYVFRGGDARDPEAGDLLYTVDATVDGELFGSSLAGGGDFNGDGVPDIAIGARPAVRTALGRLRVASGVDGQPLFELAGASPGDRFASAVAFAGDVNGDGFDDVVVGAPGGGEPGGNPGRVYVIGGGLPGSPGREPALLGILDGLEDGDLFGAAVAGVGDQDGDGIEDVAVGAPRADSGDKRDAGRVRVYSVRNRTVIHDLGGQGPNAGFGALVAAVGDLDRNGRRDLSVSDLFRKGQASIYLLGDENGNGRRDVCEPCRVSDVIRPETPIDFDLCPLTPGRCFRIDPAPGKALRLVLESTPDDETGMVLGWGVPPTPKKFDEAAERSSENRQQIIISQARNATAYVMVESFKADACTGGLRIRLEEYDTPVIDEMVPRSAGPRMLDTVVRGAGFAPGLVFALVPRPPDDPPDSVVRGVTTIVDSETAEVSFDLRTAPFGAYDLVAEVGAGPNPEPVARLEQAFGVNATRGPALQVALTGPVLYRVRDRGTLTLHYRNNGDEDIPAPLFLVTPTGADSGAELRLPGESQDAWRPTVQVLGVDPQGPVHRLPPGARGKVKIYFRSPLHCNQCSLVFRVLVFTPDGRDFINWRELPNPDPTNFDDERWRRVLSPLSVNLGNTWRAYHAALLDRSRRLARRGGNPASVRQIFGFSVLEAERRGSAAVLGTVILASDLTPIAGTPVIARRAGEVIAVAVTDNAGRFVLDGVKAGETYDIAVGGYAIRDETRRGVTLPEESYSAGGAGDLLNLVLPVEPDGAAGGPPPSPDDGPSLPERALLPPPDLFTTVAAAEVTIVLSRDPNKKTFAITPGDVLFPEEEEEEPEEDENLPPPPVIEYTIFFENSRCASVAARTVTIIDTLNGDMFDFSTLQLEAVSLGEDREEKLFLFDENTDIATQRRVSYTARDVPVVKVPPLRELPPECDDGNLPDCEGDEEAAEGDPPEYGMLDEVEVEVTLRDVPGENTKELTWDIDGCPSGKCHTVVGFLPPNDCATHQGEGFVCFTISPAEEFEDGEVENDVEVIFDGDSTAALSHHVTTDLGATEPPEPPTLPVPPDNPEGDEEFLVPVDQSLSWSPVLHADGYRLSVWALDEDGLRVEEILSGVELTEPFYRPPADRPWSASTTYQWEVIATNTLGDSPATVWTFRTEGSPPSPPDVDFMPVYPPDGGDAIVPDLELVWDLEGSESEVSSFTVYVWEGSAERDRPEAHVGDETSYRPLDLELDVLYNWQVVGVNNGGATEGPVWTFTTGEGGGFLRGDTNADGTINIADAILLLNFLFAGETSIPCLRAADFDDDGALLVTDAIAEMDFLFLGGPPPPPPMGTCGSDGTADDLGCESFPACG